MRGDWLCRKALAPADPTGHGHTATFTPEGQRNESCGHCHSGKRHGPCPFQNLIRSGPGNDQSGVNYLRFLRETMSPVRPSATSANVPGAGTEANGSTPGVFGVQATAELIPAFSLQPCGRSADAADDTINKIATNIFIIMIDPPVEPQLTLTFP